MMIFALLAYLCMVECQFQIKSPAKLVQKLKASGENETNIPFNLANFGYVPYGQQIYGDVYIANPINACNISDTETGPVPDEVRSPVRILLAKRGECPFVQKSVVAQKQGYSLLILVDNRNEDFMKLDLISQNKSIEVDIPVIMISQEDGQLIIDFMAQPENAQEIIQSVIKFASVQKSEIVEYQYWFSAMDNGSYSFLDQFYPFQKSMEKKLKFTPHYSMIPCGYCKKKGWNVKDTSCVSGGRYCASDPDGDGPLQGRDAILQILKQICIFQADEKQWWKYVLGYKTHCLGSVSPLECEQKVMTNYSISYNKVEKCVNDSFEGKKDIDLDDSVILRNEYQQHQIREVSKWPLLVVNDQHYTGSLTIPTTQLSTTSGDKNILDTTHYGPLQLICRSFIDDQQPSVCSKSQVYIVDYQIVDYSPGSSTWLIWVLVITGMVIIMLLSMYFFRRIFIKTNNQVISQQVNMALSQYYVLTEKEKSIQVSK